MTITMPAILVVGDQSAERGALRTMLTPLGHTVVEADSGRAALRAVLRDEFAVILMDVAMSAVDGYETARLIRQRPQSRRTPIVFVTPLDSDPAQTAAAYAHGAIDVVATPVQPELLRAKVSALVDLFAQAQELQHSLQTATTENASLRAGETRASTVLENVAEGIVTAGADGLIQSCNPSACRLFGYREQDVNGQPLQLLFAPVSDEELSESTRADRSLLDTITIPGLSSEAVGCRQDGSRFPIELEIREAQLGARPITIACVRDVSARKAYTVALEQRMLRDGRTGLPNRALFMDRIERELAFAQRSDESRAVLLVDLDTFPEIGAASADALLREVAQRLHGEMRASDTVGYLSDDTFGILPASTADVDAAAAIAWKLRDCFGRPFALGGDAVDVGANIGMAFFPQHGRASADLLWRAGLATHRAKRSTDHLAVFEHAERDSTARRLTRLNALRDGIARDELVLHYQPKVDLQAGLRTIGVEALVRWDHPTEGLLAPKQFMPLAERSELVRPLTRWVLNQALHDQRQWSDAGFDLTMAVNISARSLTRHSDLPETVGKLTDTWGVQPGRLILELTESTIIDASVARVLAQLHSMGERLAIDDFGTGHSSLTQLRRLTVDEITVDRSLVMNLPSASGDAMTVRSTIELAHNLGLTVVAEGVEDQAALELLVADGCDRAQGYYFSPPRPAPELTAWLNESPFGVQHHG